MTRVRFAGRVIGQIILRATNILNGEMQCEQCGAVCASRADFEIDHCTAEGFQPSKERRPLTAKDGQLLCRKCHDLKTSNDIPEIGRARRLAEKHRRVVGVRGPSEIGRRFGVAREEPEK